MAELKKNNFYKTSRCTWGGNINVSDFNTYEPNTNRTNEFINAEKFNEDICKRRELQKMYKDMSLEELRENKLISNTDGRPSSTLTDNKWQNELAIRKLSIKPYPDNVKKFGGKFSKESVFFEEDKHDTYDGITNYQQYCTFINDVLSNIRSGQVDYCYYIYQIVDLLKFHYNSLMTKYCDGYWEIWLSNY